MPNGRDLFPNITYYLLFHVYETFDASKLLWQNFFSIVKSLHKKWNQGQKVGEFFCKAIL